MPPESDLRITTPDGAIATDVNCLHCEYNLRGLPPETRCPECGASISELLDNLLCLADRAWLGKLRLGVRLALWTVGTVAVGIIAAFGLALTAHSEGIETVLGCFTAALGVIVAALALASLVFITSPEPRRTHVDGDVTLRRAVRMLGCLAIPTTLVLNYAAAAAESVTPLWVSSPFLLGGVLAFFGSLVLLRRFARRIPERRLARSTTVVIWGLGVTLAAVAGSVAFIAAVNVPTTPPGAAIVTTMPAATAPAVQAEDYSSTRPATGPATTSVAAAPTINITRMMGQLLSLLAAFMCVSFLALLFFGLRYVRLLWRYREAFSRVSAQARALASGTDT